MESSNKNEELTMKEHGFAAVYCEGTVPFGCRI